MDEISFKVQGSATDPYLVTFVRRPDGNLSGYCTCPAGENGLYCKHRFAIIDGVQGRIVSSNTEDVCTVQSWLTGTDIEKHLLRVRELEREYERLKKALTAAKKKLAVAMRD